MTRGPDKQFDRDEALDKAMELFWAKGYEGTGVSELLEHMGIGRQSMYDTFGSKRSLFFEALGRYSSQLRSRVMEQLQAPGSPMQNVRNVFDVWMAVLDEGGDYGCFIGNTVAELAPHEPEVASMMRASMEGVGQALAATLRRAQAEGELSSEIDAEDLATVVVATVQGTALVNKLYGHPGIAPAVLRGFMRLLEENKPGAAAEEPADAAENPAGAVGEAAGAAGESAGTVAGTRDAGEAQ